MRRFSFFSLFIVLVTVPYIVAAQFPITIKQITGGSKGTLNEQDAIAGIREALIKGTGDCVGIVSAMNGYLGNPEIKIPFPENARDIENKLRALGFGKNVDEVITTINHAAEDAAKSALPVFTSAIKHMTVNDALGIVKGSPDAATLYLRKTTTGELQAQFLPIVKSSLEKTGATSLWSDVVKQYNQIPFVKKQDPDLSGYVTAKAIDGLFIMLAKEEARIRKDPAARTSEILKKVFGT
jgi:hypothetical protein